MGRSDKRLLLQLRSARKWLEKAETEFAKKADIRGELNLMLAEAEMKNMRKHHTSAAYFKSYGMYIVAAIVFIGAGVGIRALSVAPVPTVTSDIAVQSLHKGAPSPAAGETAERKESASLRGQRNSVRATPALLRTVPSAASKTACVPEKIVTRTDDNAAVLSTRQMQETVQAACRSLQSTEIQNE